MPSAGLLNLIARYLADSAMISIAEAVNLGRGNGFVEYNRTVRPDSNKAIGAYQWSALLDRRVCHICRRIDGMFFAANDPLLPQIWAPVHKGCRCILVGVLREELENYPVAITSLTNGLVAFITSNRFWLSESRVVA